MSGFETSCLLFIRYRLTLVVSTSKINMDIKKDGYPSNPNKKVDNLTVFTLTSYFSLDLCIYNRDEHTYMLANINTKMKTMKKLK